MAWNLKIVEEFLSDFFTLNRNLLLPSIMQSFERFYHFKIQHPEVELGIENDMLASCGGENVCVHGPACIMVILSCFQDTDSNHNADFACLQQAESPLTNEHCETREI